MYSKSMGSYDEIPEGMKAYINNYGCHFNKKLCEEACSRMTTRLNGQVVPLECYSKKEVDDLLKTYNIRIKRNTLYDYVYVANMCKADFFKRSVPNTECLARYIADVLDDVDAEDGYVFNRFYADTVFMNRPIEWEDMI